MWSNKASSIISDIRNRQTGKRGTKHLKARQQKQHRKNNPTSLPNEWTESVKVIDGDWSIQDSCPSIVPFLIPSRPNCAIIFLPPKYHLLFMFKKVAASDDNSNQQLPTAPRTKAINRNSSISTHIIVRTDYSWTLSFVDAMFDHIQ